MSEAAVMLAYGRAERRGVERWWRWWWGVIGAVGILLFLDGLAVLAKHLPGAGMGPVGGLLRGIMGRDFLSPPARVMAALVLPAAVLRMGVSRRMLAVVSAGVLMMCGVFTLEEPTRFEQFGSLAFVMAVGVVVVAVLWHADTVRELPGLLVRAAALGGMTWVVGMALFDVETLYIYPEARWGVGIWGTEVGLPVEYLLVILAWCGIGVLGTVWVARDTRWRTAVAAVAALILVGVGLVYPATIRWKLILRQFAGMGRYGQSEIYSYAGSRWSGQAFVKAGWEMLWAQDWSKSRGHPMVQSFYGESLVIQKLPDDPATRDEIERFLGAHEKQRVLPYFAPRLGAAHRTEYAAAILKYALFDRDTECLNALQLMHFPQAAWAVWYDPARFRANADMNREMVALLTPPAVPGVDGVSTWELDWTPILKERALGRHAGFADGVCDEADGVVAQYLRAIAATERLKAALPAMVLSEFYEPQLRGLLEDRQGRGWSMMGIRPVNCDGNMADLAAEVDRFVRDVDVYVGGSAGGGTSVR